jgi:hypothetical protein
MVYVPNLCINSFKQRLYQTDAAGGVSRPKDDLEAIAGL